jgi:hypothetical protein
LVAISGVFTAPNPWQVTALNRAIARAFANTTTFGGPIPAFAGRVPPANDGSLLLARLSQPDACSGGADYTAVIARACTRVAPASVMTPIAAPPATRNPPAPVSAPPAPVSTTPVRPAPTPTPVRPTPTPVRTVAPVAPQVLVPTPVASSGGMRGTTGSSAASRSGGIGGGLKRRHRPLVAAK